MSLPAESRRKIRFAEFEIDMHTAEVWQNGRRFVLQGQPFQILAVLLERPGELVTREELKKRLWPSDTFVDFDRSLNKAVNRLRETLSDSAETPRYIETLPRRGYRLIAEVARDESSEIPASHDLPEKGGEHIPGSPEVRDATVSTKSWKFVATIALSFLTAAAVWRFLPRPHGTGSLSFENLEVTRLTNNGTVSNVAISPDGRYVAYVPNFDAHGALRLRQVATGSDTQILPPDLGLFVGLTFSPDGNYIYFVRSDRNDISFRYLYSVPFPGGSPQKLITDVDSNISFSPDGRQITYEHWDPPNNAMELKIANADGTGQRTLAVIHDTSFFMPGGPGPAWSPDGRTIVDPKIMVKGPYRSVLFAVSAKTGIVGQLYAGSEAIGRAVWRPSGDALLLQMFDPHSRRAQLWTISFPEGVLQRLTHDASEYWQDLDLTKDGKTVAAINASTQTRIWAADARNLSAIVPITPTDPPMVRVTTDSQGKVFARDFGGDIWSMNFDGSAPTKLEGAHDANMIQSCGDFIVFTVTRENSEALMRVDADGTHPTELARGNIFSPTCAREPQNVYYVSYTGPQTIWRIGIQGGTVEKVSGLPGDDIIGLAVVSPDGKFLAYPYSTYTTGTFGDHYAVVHASDGSIVKSFDMPHDKFDFGPYWSADGKYLQFVTTRGGVSNIWQHPVLGGPARQLTHFSSEEIFDFSWSSDGSRLFLTRGRVTADVVLLSGLR
jgi:DNA-binding winged helix-turn-helix (wHTH) protein/Tol biopolymer transport system component